MDEITRLLGSIERKRTESVSTQSTGSKLALLHRLHQLMTCVEDLNPKNELHERVVKTLDYAFLVCGKRANKPKKDSFRWRLMLTAQPPRLMFEAGDFITLMSLYLLQ